MIQLKTWRSGVTGRTVDMYSHCAIMVTMSVKYTKELLEEAVRNSTSYAGVLRSLNLRQAGGTQWHIIKRIKAFQIDTSHFTGSGWSKGKTFEHIRKSKEQILTILPEGSPCTRRLLLKRAMLESSIEYKCSECPIMDQWNNKPIVLEIDHIDGNWLNNLLSNLRFLCPNCHSQQPTSRSHKHALIGELVYPAGLEPVPKSVPVRVRVGAPKYCIDCNKLCSTKATRCKKCTGIFLNPPKIQWPSNTEILLRIANSSWSQLAKELGVSCNAIRYRLRRYPD